MAGVKGALHTTEELLCPDYVLLLAMRMVAEIDAYLARRAAFEQWCEQEGRT